MIAFQCDRCFKYKLIEDGAFVCVEYAQETRACKRYVFVCNTCQEKPEQPQSVLKGKSDG